MSIILREDTCSIMLYRLDGDDANPVPYDKLGSWSTYEGGELEADTSKFRPGNFGKEQDVGGPASRGDATVKIQLTDQNFSWFNDLEALIGVGRFMIGVTYVNPRTKKAIDTSGFTRKGTLKSVPPTDLDSNSNSPLLLEVVISCDE